MKQAQPRPLWNGSAAINCVCFIIKANLFFLSESKLGDNAEMAVANKLASGGILYNYVQSTLRTPSKSNTLLFSMIFNDGMCN